MISLSLRSTTHPLSSQAKWVRSSTTSYRCFNLVMDRSPPLRVHSLRLDALFGLAFAAPSPRKGLRLPQTMPPGPIMQKVRRHPTRGLRPLVGNWFQVYFTPLTGVLFTFPSRYWFTIGRLLVFSLTRWSAQIHTGFHVSRATQDTPRFSSVFAYGSITLYGFTFQRIPLTFEMPSRSPTTPLSQARTVWAVPLSLAATKGIAFAFFSSAY